MYPLFRAREKMVFLLSVLGFMAPFGAPSLTAQTPRFDELTPGLVSIETHRNTKPDDWNDQFQWEAEELGTGFIVADHDGLVRVLTAEHVVQGASEVTVSLSSDKGIKATARVLTRVDVLDLALLEVRFPSRSPMLDSLVAYRYPADHVVKPSMPVWTENWNREAAQNNVMRLDLDSDTRRFVYTANSIGEGFSGGPVFDQDGRLVGIHVLSRDETRSYKVMVAVKIDAALGTLESLGFALPTFNKLTAGAATIALRPDEIRSALSSVDMKTLSRLGNNQTSEIQDALRARAGDGKTTIARSFFDNSNNSPDAVKWFDSLLATGLDPNMTVSTDYYGKEGILLEAMRAGNVEAMKILLKRGASPHAFQDLFLTPYPVTRFVFPLESIATDDRLDVERKKDLANAFLEAGAIVPKLFPAGGLGPGPELYEAKHLQEQLASQLGLRPPTSPTICESLPNRVCTAAKTRTGVDWCGAIAAMPKSLEHNYKDASSVPIYTVQLLYLLTIEDNKAYFLASESAYSDYVLVEIPKDASSWTVMRFMEPGYGMGLCRQDSGESFRADRCWRRISLNRVSGSDEMTSELWGQKWRLTSPTCSQ